MLALKHPTRVDSSASLARGGSIPVSDSHGLIGTCGMGESRRNTVSFSNKPNSLSHTTSAPLVGDRPFATLSEFHTAFVSNAPDGISFPDDFGLPVSHQRGKK